MNFLISLLLVLSFQNFEEDFLNGNLKNLEKYFSGDRKVYIELSVPFNVYGFLSKSQVLSLFKEIFLNFQTEEFKIIEKIEGGDSIILKIHWKISDRITKEKKDTSVFMRLGYENNKWCISEIKGT